MLWRAPVGRGSHRPLMSFFRTLCVTLPVGSRTMTLGVKKTPALPGKCTFMNRVTRIAYLNVCRSVGGRSARYPLLRAAGPAGTPVVDTLHSSQ